MAPVAFARAAILIVLALIFAAGDAAAREIVVVAGTEAGTEVKITNMRTGETRTVRTETGGEARFKRMPGATYKVESAVTETQYVEVVDEPGLVPHSVHLEKIAPGDPDRALQRMEPNIRDSVKRALDSAPTPADKAKALQEEAKKVEEHLTRSLAANERMPGLVNITVIVESLNAIQTMRAHYLALSRPAAPDRRQSAIQPWERWESPFPSYFGVLADGESIELSRVGIGTVINGGGERALLRSSDRVTGASVGAEFGYRLDWLGGLNAARVVGSYSYLDAGDTGTAEVPVGGADTAITYHRQAANGSTGLALGNTGLSASEKVEVNAHRVTVGLAGDVPLGGGGRFYLSPFVGLKYERFTQKYEGTLQSLSFNDIRSTTDQKITQTLFGPSFGAYLSWLPCDSTRISFGGKLDVLRSWDDLDSRQSNFCGLCGPDEQDFDASVDDEDDYWTYRFSLRAAIEHALAEHVRVGAHVGARFLGDRAGVANPENPSQPGPHLTSDSAADVYGGLGIRLTF